MSRILITADVHFGLSGRLDNILWAMRTIREYAHREKIATVCILGDLFHDRESLNIEVLSKSYQFFEEAKEKYSQKWVIFPGNHDMYLRNSWEINTLQTLNRVAHIVEDVKLLKIDGYRFWIIPFVHYESVYMKVLKQIEERWKPGDVLLTHIGVNNATLNECYLLKHWSIVDFDQSKFDRVFAGHFHCHQNVGSRNNVWYPGSPIPFRFDEGMVPHGFIVYDLDSREVEFVDIFDLSIVDGIRPPDYLTITDEMLSDLTDAAGDHVRIQLLQDYTADGLARMASALKSRGVLSVKFVKQKTQQLDIEQTNTDLSLEQPTTLFDKWLEHDKPKKLDLELLKKLNTELVSK